MERYKFKSNEHKNQFIDLGFDDIDFHELGSNSNQKVVDILEANNIKDFNLVQDENKNYFVVHDDTEDVVMGKCKLHYHFTSDEVDMFLEKV